MLAISKMAAAVVPSATLAAGAKAKQLKAKGIEVFDFSLGEPDFPTPPHAIEAAYKAALAGETKYPPIDGIKPLKSFMLDHTDDDELQLREELLLARLGILAAQSFQRAAHHDVGERAVEGGVGARRATRCGVDIVLYRPVLVAERLGPAPSPGVCVEVPRDRA